MAVRKLSENEKASINIYGDEYELPLIVGSEGEVGIDIAKLRAESGAVTLDNAFVNTASATSAITFLDGEKGILRYRGYPIEQLAEKASFLETAYLLVDGERPDASKLEAFTKQIASHHQTPEAVQQLIKSFPKTAHPMGVLSAALVALSAHNEALCKQDLSDSEKWDAVAQLMAQIKCLSAYFYRHATGQEFIAPDSSKPYCVDFLHMLFGKEPQQEVVDALNVLLILHADHEQNCSTSTVRLVGSSKANPYATVAAGVSALWGPLHGGANQAVIEMLEQIRDAGGDYKSFLDKAKDKSDPFKLMGFGHRVYKNFDPRAKIIKKSCDDILRVLGINDPLLDIAKGLEEEALRDPYFVDRKLYPNVDFYSGIIYKALNIPTNMFTAMFALGRLPGWLAQWKEMLDSPAMKIGRPRQIYTGEEERDFK